MSRVSRGHAMNMPSASFHGGFMEYPKHLTFDGLEVGSLGYRRMANRRYYFRNTESEKIRSNEWRKNNLDKYKDWADKNKERIRANSRKAEYNLLPEDYERKKIEQGNKCAICKSEVDLLVVDHDHSCCSRRRGANRKTCGKCNRGLLCRSCNTMIGLAKESKIILSNAIEYLRSYNVS